jgi:hypothetical protein
MSTTIDDGTSIKFTYTYDELFEVVSLVTNEIAVTILDNEGMPLVDEYGISEDEKYTVIQKMHDAANEIFEHFMKITNGIADSVEITTTEVECSIKDKEAYNVNVLAAIDRLIKNALVNYIIKDWFIDKKIGDHAEIYNLKYLKNIKDIVRRSVQLRKPTIS